MEPPLQSERRSRTGKVGSFHDAAIHEEVLREEAASLDDVDNFDRRAQPIMKGLSSAREIEGLVLV